MWGALTTQSFNGLVVFSETQALLADWASVVKCVTGFLQTIKSD